MNNQAPECPVNEYLRLYKDRMKRAPAEIGRFCDASLSDEKRTKLVSWIRDLNCRTSCQKLQISYAFSVPTEEVLILIKSLRRSIISIGAGTGYWEHLLRSIGCTVVCYDANRIYPKEMRFIPIQTGGPEVLSNYTDHALFIAWPDDEESSEFGRDCLMHYKGDIVIHVGELVGCTHSSNPWGQSSSRIFQLQLFENFRRLKEIRLPNWPGHMDTLTLWTRAKDPVECDGAMFQYVPSVVC